MKSCPPICEMEKIHQHPESNSLVSDSECICRFAFHPLHYDEWNNLKINFLREKDIIDSMSFWRIRNKEELKDRINKTKMNLPVIKGEEQQLKAVYKIPVSEIREFKPKIFGRIFHVLDNCKTDESGGFDIDHCIVGVCNYHVENIRSNSDGIDSVRGLLFRLIANKKNRVDLSELELGGEK